jgi:N-acetylglutamate synthase-like GNAT family acetyltransferase
MIAIMELVAIIRPEPDRWDDILTILKTANFHAIGGAEMPEFPLSDCFVALCESQLAGVAGYKILDATTAKTTLLAVHPDYRRRGIGLQLAQARLEYLRSQGIKQVFTNCDDPEVISWNERHFGFHKTGKLIPKLEDYGCKDRDHWINLFVEI